LHRSFVFSTYEPNNNKNLFPKRSAKKALLKDCALTVLEIASALTQHVIAFCNS